MDALSPESLEGMVSTSDRVTTRTWTVDLSLAGKVRSPSTRPPKRARQGLVIFLGEEGTFERFAIRQTMPYAGYEVAAPPSQAQYDAVLDFYCEPCETRYQASLLLSARDFSENIAKSYNFTQFRRRLIWIAVANYILSDREHRSRVQSWNIARFRGPSVVSGNKAFRPCSKFAESLIKDMQSRGAKIFG